MRALTVISFVAIAALGAPLAVSCEPVQIVDPPGQQATNVYWAFTLADAVVLVDLVSAHKYAVDGNYSGLDMVLKVAKSYKGPYRTGELVKVDAFNACVAPSKPTQQVLLYLCGEAGKTLKYCRRSEDWRIEIPGDRAAVEQIAGRPEGQASLRFTPNFRMQRSGWDKVPFETTAAGR
jgi:hypothetical protein